MDNFLAKLNYPPGINATIARRILPQLSAFYSLDMLYKLSDLMRVEHLLDYNSITVETAGRLLTATCEETLIKCRWNRRLVNCSDLFEMEFTGDGFCCVFNGRSLRREMENHELNIKQTLSRKKWYTKLFGYTSGLMLAINQSQTLTSVDLSYKWVALQTGNYFVDVTMNGTAVSPGSEHWIAYYTTGYQIALGAKTLHPSLRKCNMASEKLKYFPKYSQKYCTLEKEIANTLDKCKCVRSNHPKPPGAMRCRAAMLRCATQAMVAFDALSTDCPMTCDTKKPTMKASRFVLDETVSTVEPFYQGLNFKKVTVVRVFIQSRKRPTVERWTYYDYIDLFSQLGGMFSVFFGCSVLTLLALLQIIWRALYRRCLQFWSSTK
ncbi:sodium channel protein Nach-like [Spodoptera litura]|uniref:Sodium channel protein Nach-like n=1 Tax=Spodoptera litura TaxID=69820 RepID=A0A9J7EJ33_SPOLT|nr:sodium channel protein Nach-like [Spodoptera litura]